MTRRAAKQNVSGAGDVNFTDTKRVKELVALMRDNDLTELELVENKSKIILRRGGVAVAYAPPAPAHGPHHTPASPPAPEAPADPDAGLVAIKSPMVGTFYPAASPDAAPFANVGTVVNEKTIVCIIEAMKVFNEIPSEVKGTIVRVVAQNGQAVEFGQALFMVKPE